MHWGVFFPRFVVLGLAFILEQAPAAVAGERCVFPE